MAAKLSAISIVAIDLYQERINGIIFSGTVVYGCG